MNNLSSRSDSLRPYLDTKVFIISIIALFFVSGVLITLQNKRQRPPTPPKRGSQLNLGGCIYSRVYCHWLLLVGLRLDLMDRLSLAPKTKNLSILMPAGLA